MLALSAGCGEMNSLPSFPAMLAGNLLFARLFAYTADSVGCYAQLDVDLLDFLPKCI
jgi:hypothetical protein